MAAVIDMIDHRPVWVFPLFGGGAGIFKREDFNRCRPNGGNKSTVKRRLDDGRVAICSALSTPVRAGTIFEEAPLFAGRSFPLAHKEIGDMRQVNSFLRSASSRIGRRFALVVAIAAASLPSAGA
jgi:hypothetical protein